MQVSLHYLLPVAQMSPDCLRTAEARLQQQADLGSSRAAELLEQWDEGKNVARPEGEPWWIRTSGACVYTSARSAGGPTAGRRNSTSV